MGKKPRTVGTGRAILAAFAAALIMKLFFFDFMIAEGVSMEPAIKEGSILLVNRIAYGFRLPWAGHYSVRWGRPKPGDVVVFSSPLGHSAVKRCGEIGEKTFVALGDNREASYDSRSYGPVELDTIIGKVMGIKSASSP